MKLGIIGSGGFGRETLLLARDIASSTQSFYDDIFFIEFDEFFKDEVVDNVKVLKLSSIDLQNFVFVIAIGDCHTREKVSKSFSNKARFTSLISPRSYVSKDLNHNDGLIVMPYCYITCNVKLGKHAQINSSCSIGHDTQIGDYLTLVSGSRIAGNNLINDRVYFSANSSTRQGVKICK